MVIGKHDNALTATESIARGFYYPEIDTELNFVLINTPFLYYTTNILRGENSSENFFDFPTPKTVDRTRYYI